jgi:hypothetical protein
MNVSTNPAAIPFRKKGGSSLPYMNRLLEQMGIWENLEHQDYILKWGPNFQEE